MIERERKFLLRYLPKEFNYISKITQGYLMLDDDRHVRVRLIENGDKVSGFLCYKQILSDTDKHEFEFEISEIEARQLLETTNFVVSKIRYQRSKEETKEVIDYYPDFKFYVAEIEYENTLETIPEWSSTEVTGNKHYSNIYLAKLK